METRAVLEETRRWVVAQIEKAKTPHAERFNLTSINFCIFNAMEKSGGSEKSAEAALAVLRSVTIAENRPTHDVLMPTEVLEVIDTALKAA